MGKAQVSAHELVAGRYRLLEVFARETNRLWWYAEDVAVDRPRMVAQTALPDPGPADSAPRATARIVRTSETMRLLCPGRVARVVDAVVEAGTLWTVAEWIDGTPLGQLLDQEGPFPPGRAARIGLDVLDVLRAAHDAGITHGELSPDQVFVRARGPALVAGFGLAGATLVPRVTAPSYASPEQARDERLGPAADLWALGAILYTMVEGRPPFRDRGRPDATLKAVDRLPLRAPLRTGPLTQTVQGLLRKNSRERLTRPVVREALVRALDEEEEAGPEPADGRGRHGGAGPVRHGGAGAVRHGGVRGALGRRGPGRGRRALAAGCALAVLAVTVAALAATHHLPGGSTTSASPGASAVPSPSATRTDGTGGGTASARPGAGTGSASALPDGYRRLTAQEGFSVALPPGWKRLSTVRGTGHAYRITFGPGGDAPALAVTHSEGLGPDPVAVWRDDVEPGLERLDGYHRIGSVRATT